MWGGEIFVPKIPSYRVTDLAQAIGPNCRQEVVGIRPGEKIHEEMITTSDSQTTIDLGKYYAVLPGDVALDSVSDIGGMSPLGGAKGFSYNSRDNTEFLSVDQIRSLLRQHVDANFDPV